MYDGQILKTTYGMCYGSNSYLTPCVHSTRQSLKKIHNSVNTLYTLEEECV